MRSLAIAKKITSRYPMPRQLRPREQNSTAMSDKTQPAFMEGSTSTEAMAARMAALWKSNPTNRMQLPQNMKAADADGDGKIDAGEEFYDLLGSVTDNKMSRSEMDKLFAEADKDGDGELDLEECASPS
jgi:Ca2+-binding EF-hand superfamily protein